MDSKHIFKCFLREIFSPKKITFKKITFKLTTQGGDSADCMHLTRSLILLSFTCLDKNIMHIQNHQILLLIIFLK